MILLSLAQNAYSLDVNRGFDISVGYSYSDSLRENVFLNAPITNQSPVNSTGEITVELYTSLQDIYQSLGGDNNVYPPGSFKYSEQSLFFEKSLGNYTAFTFQNFDLFSSENGGIIADEFAYDYNSLPENFDEKTCKYYKLFLETYGTHIIDQATFGGQITMSSSFSPDIFDNTGSNYRITSDLTELFNLYTKKLPLSSDELHDFNRLKEKYPSTITFIGGSSDKYSSHQSIEWVNTIPLNPVLTNVSLQQIDGKSLRKAVNLYLNNNTQIPYIISSRVRSTALLVNGEIVLAGGSTSFTSQSDFDIPLETYSQNKWNLQESNIPSFPWSIIGEYNGEIFYLDGDGNIASFDLSLQITKQYTNGTRYNRAQTQLIHQGIIYFFGEYIITFNTSNKQTQNITKNTSIYNHVFGSAVYCNGLVYVVGGVESSAVETFNLASYEWNTIKDMHDSRSYFQALCISDVLYSVGGNMNENTNLIKTINIERYYDGVWKIITDFPLQRYGSASVNINEKIYVFGGQEVSNNYVYPLNIDIYDIKSGTWNQTPLTEERWC